MNVAPRVIWPALVSLGFASISIWLSRLYSKLHWKVLYVVGGRPREWVETASFSAAVEVLDQLWLVKAFAALLALIFSLWGTTLVRPRWPGIIAVAAALVAASLAFTLE